MDFGHEETNKTQLGPHLVKQLTVLAWNCYIILAGSLTNFIDCETFVAIKCVVACVLWQLHVLAVSRYHSERKSVEFVGSI